MKELNSLESRRGRKPLDINNVVYWFKNARAAQKRAELRGFCTPLLNMNVNGFHGFHSPIRTQPPSLISSDQHSVSEDEMSRLSDNDDNGHIDINDNDTDVPLSLTTSNNPRNTNDYYREEKSSPHEDLHNDVDGVHIKEEPMENEGKRNCKEPENLNSPVKEMETNRQEKYAENNEASPRASSASPKPPTPMLDRPENNDVVNNNNVSNDDNFSDDEDVNDDERSTIDLRSRKDSAEDLRSPSPSSGVLMSRLPPGFPLVPNSMFSHSIMYMSHYMPGLSPIGPARDQSMLALSQDERRKRNRTFIDPVTEVPRLEQW